MKTVFRILIIQKLYLVPLVLKLTSLLTKRNIILSSIFKRTTKENPVNDNHYLHSNCGNVDYKISEFTKETLITNTIEQLIKISVSNAEEFQKKY